jgi:hypothetical protein
MFLLAQFQMHGQVLPWPRMTKFESNLKRGLYQKMRISQCSETVGTPAIRLSEKISVGPLDESISQVCVLG